ncbi:MAG: altronate dehydratase [Deltaproteobacteria bacterium]|nr:altronate dehydratase [Deltaproteobacteria bacterium]
MSVQLPKTIHLNKRDNVAVALFDLQPGDAVEVGHGSCIEPIPAGHKVAVRPIDSGAAVHKYGQIIGFASQDIHSGAHVHSHNLKMGDFSRDYAMGVDSRPTAFVPEDERATFQGFVREDGRVGTRNYIGVLATVNCSASVARFIADAVPEDLMARYPHVDGIVSLGHGTGCGLGTRNEGFSLLQRALSGYAQHPNFGGVLLVGLGCEVNNMDCFLENTALKTGPQVRTLNIQEAGGSRETVRLGVEAVTRMLETANSVNRRQVTADRLVLGLECGGSDAYSGITANPALGAAVDLLVAHGGTAILSETPEIYGAEHLLTRRARDNDVGDKLIERIRWWEEHTARHKGTIDNNPTPGNKAGGLTTILEKSLGAAAKGGSTNLNAVFGYGETVTAAGLVFMDTPGYDAVSVTGMIAGGANVVCFTTGRGTVCGFKPTPTIKLASNTAMYERLKDDMDVNCGRIVDGDASIRKMGENIFRLILETASGKATRSERLGFGDNEFVPWQFSPVM